MNRAREEELKNNQMQESAQYWKFCSRISVWKIRSQNKIDNMTLCTVNETANQ